MSESLTFLSRMAGISFDGELGAALTERMAILDMNVRANDAVLSPVMPGRFSHAFRAALAVRMSHALGVAPCEAYYREVLAAADPSPTITAVAEGGASDDLEEPLRQSLAYVDIVTAHPRDLARSDIVDLQKSGLTDTDIVQLAELVACINYQIRVAKGLSALQEAQ